MKCVNCKGTGKLIGCFYCGGGYCCAYCVWTAGDRLPDSCTDWVQASDDGVCCLCTGSGIQRDIDPEDEHLLLEESK